MHVQTEATSWLIYPGKFDSEQQATYKKAELARAGIESELITNRAEYQPGLTLGFFRQQTNAESRLQALHEQNITEAHIIAWTTQPIGQLLRIEQAAPEQIRSFNEIASHASVPIFRRCEEITSPAT